MVRASEIGAFTFCERAWGYAARGENTERQPEIDAGQRFHTGRLRRASWARTMRRIAAACFVLAAAALTIALMP